MKSVIHFYGVGSEYGEFSNFAPYPIALGGKQWPTSEHFFQAQKFAEPRDQESLRRAKTPMEAATLGRDRRKMRWTPSFGPFLGPRPLHPGTAC
jgi:hypothetical protein